MVAPLWGKLSYILSRTANATCHFFLSAQTHLMLEPCIQRHKKKGRMMLADWDEYSSESQSKRIEMESQAHGPL